MFRPVTVTNFGGRLIVPEIIAINDNIVILKRRDGPKTCERGGGPIAPVSSLS